MTSKKNSLKLASAILTVMAFVLLSSSTVSARTGVFKMDLVGETQVISKNGTYVLDWEGYAPSGSSIHITATAYNEMDFSMVFDVSGLSSHEAASMIATYLKENGWYVNWNASNEIEILRRIAGSSIEEIGTHYTNTMETEAPFISSYLKGYTTLMSEMPSNGSFVFEFTAPIEDPIVDPMYPPTLNLTLNGVNTNSELLPGYTIANVSSTLEGILQSQGYEVSAAEGLVELDWDDPANYSLLGQTVKWEIGLLNGYGSPHATISLPGESVMSDVGLALHPLATTMFYSEGGQLKYYLGVGNDGMNTIGGVLWIEVMSDQGEMYPFYDPNMMYHALEYGGSASENMILDIPAELPAGEYTLYAYFADYSSETPEMEILAYGMFAFHKMDNQPEDPNPARRFEPEFELSSSEEGAVLPYSQELFSAAPNPFNPETQLTFNLTQGSQVSLVIYDVSGRKVVTLLDGFRQAGQHQAVFNAQALPTGVYFARLSAAGQQQMQKLLLVK